ncbi:MAG: hypothetical protein K5876_01920 [Ruminiclostridium sp.]|nr:hypothetical protein [Ruminiclostridium sp.]
MEPSEKPESPERVIRACCPDCFASADKIAYRNCGPIVRIYCTVCGLVYNDGDAKKNGFDHLIDYWNHIGVYYPQDDPPNDLGG